MVSSERIWPIFAVTTLLLFALGCDEHEGESGTIEPMADEPMIVDSILCLGIEDGRPAGITDVFLESDEKIYIWIYWSNVEDGSTVEVLWFEPGEDTASLEDLQIINSSSGFAITWFSIGKPGGGFDEGNWSVDVYLDGLFERSHLFTVTD